MNLPKKCIIDTNVPIIANLAQTPDTIPEELEDCVYACIETIEHIIRTKGLIIDSGDEIYDEYRHKLALKGQPGLGDMFMKWVHDNRWNLPEGNRVSISKNGESYDEFPIHDGLIHFDRSDRKFVAVANAHPKKPPILQASDSKWWGWKDALAEAGICVKFLCEEYIQKKFMEKMS